MLHKEITAADVHVPGFVQDTDPGAVGAGKLWIDTTDSPTLVVKVRNDADDDWLVAATSSTILGTRQTAIQATASLADAADESSTMTVAKSFLLLSVETDVAARVELYATGADRDADTSRDTSTAPDPNIGLIAEVNTTAMALVQKFMPGLVGACMEDPVSTSIAYRITNASGGDSVVTATLTYVVLEL